MTTPDDVQRARTQRRRRKHERQALVFGLLIAFLAVSGLAAAAVYTGAVDAPFDRAFSEEETVTDQVATQPCLPDGTLPVPYQDISVRVLNATDRSGLAAQVSDALARRSFTNTATETQEAKLADVRISFGSQGLAAAYTLAAQFPRANLLYDARTDASIDLAIGASFGDLVPAEEIALAPDAPMTSIDGCRSLDSLTPEPLATTDPADDATDEVPAEDPPAEEPAEG